VFVTTTQLLSNIECASIINDTEQYALNNGGWTTQRHVAYPTTDLSVETVPALKWLSKHLQTVLLPEFEGRFQNANELYIEDLFIAKYEYDSMKQSGLNEHEDGSPWSFVIPLNALSAFTGGGTQFVYLKDGLFRPSIGKSVMFNGKNRHSGVPITSGIRYIICWILWRQQ
jgi:hypothetical protein